MYILLHAHNSLPNGLNFLRKSMSNQVLRLDIVSETDSIGHIIQKYELIIEIV